MHAHKPARANRLEVFARSLLALALLAAVAWAVMDGGGGTSPDFFHSLKGSD